MKRTKRREPIVSKQSSPIRKGQQAIVSLTPGMFARVRVRIGGTSGSILVPDNALSSNMKGYEFCIWLVRITKPGGANVTLGGLEEGMRVD